MYEAYLAAGSPTLEDLAADVACISDLDPAPGLEVIQACLGEAKLPAQQADAAAIAVVLARRAAWHADDFVLLIRSLWLKARLTAPLGQPLRLVTDPFALEVHRAIDHSAGHFPHGLPPLPVYVERAHDEELRQRVVQALKGTSTMAVLIGPSSTGKTRACWEAIQELPDTWRLWHPIVPGRAEAALTGIGGIGPHTVVWLNDTHHYLTIPGTGLGERVAAALRALLREPSQAPVLVLGIIWPEHWAQLVQEPGPHGGVEDPHAQARYLLAGTGITVPAIFSADDLARLHGQARRDPRLSHAARHADAGRITQYLAGAPALLERYRTAPPAPRALIEAAMDAGGRTPSPCRTPCWKPRRRATSPMPSGTPWAKTGSSRPWPTAPPPYAAPAVPSLASGPDAAPPLMRSLTTGWRTSSRNTGAPPASSSTPPPVFGTPSSTTRTAPI
ncbi:hypothetical protein ACFV7R_45280 [Streptomyces sp. NPDC059866]|uniref:hypothetical protein n=1 Tax=Streptomyces sp. NPDC059866 TaxID=3346978 RepID=UPI003659C3C4